METMTGGAVQCMDQPAGGATTYVEQLTSRLFALQRKQILCDVTILADDGERHAHSAVLAASSQLICRKLQQFDSRTQHRVYVPGCDLATLDLVLRLLYTGDIELRDVQDLCRVIHVCTSLGVDLRSLHNICVTIDNRSSSIVYVYLHCLNSVVGLPSVPDFPGCPGFAPCCPVSRQDQPWDA